MTATARTSLTATCICALACLAFTGCGSDRAPVADWQKSEHQIRILNPGATHLDAVVTRETFNKLFPQSVWFEEGEVLGMYNKDTKMTFVVVSEHLFSNWSDEMSAMVEHMCHEKSHRADDLYEGDSWSELRATSAPGLNLDTHHYGEAVAHEAQNHGQIVTTVGAVLVASASTEPQAP